MITIRINASALKTTACLRRYWYMTQLGWVNRAGNDILETGSAVHDFAAQVLKGEDEFKAIQVIKKYKDTVRATARAACASNNLHEFPKPLMVVIANGKFKTVEYPFSVLIERGKLGEVDYELYFEGTLDFIGAESDWLRIIDHKTTRAYDKHEAFARYQYDPQMMFYNWILRNYGEKIVGKSYGNQVSTAVNLIQIGREVKWTLGTNWWYTDRQMKYFEDGLRVTVMRIKHMIGEWLLRKQEPLREGMVNTACKYCDYAIHCTAEDEVRAAMAAGAFTVEEYKPLSER